MNEQQQIESKLRELLPELTSRFNIEKLGYFGSLANGNFSDKSDIDILVHFNKPIGWEFFDLQELLENCLKRKVDLISDKGLRTQLRENILNQVKYIR